MQRYLFIFVIITSISVLTYFSINNQIETEQYQAARSVTELNTTGDINDKLEQLVKSLQNLQETQQQQLQQTQLEQARLKKMVIELQNTRLETKHNFAVVDETIELDINASFDIAEPGETVGRKLGDWMNGTLHNESRDANDIALIREQTNQSLINLPSVSLDDLQCAERFCRATFSDSQNSGELPNVQKLMGHPPFTGDGFTVEAEDGRVSLYFTGAGVKLGDLQRDASRENQLN